MLGVVTALSQLADTLPETGANSGRSKGVALVLLAAGVLIVVAVRVRPKK